MKINKSMVMDFLELMFIESSFKIQPRIPLDPKPDFVQFDNNCLVFQKFSNPWPITFKIMSIEFMI